MANFSQGCNFGTVAGLRIRCNYIMNLSLGAIKIAPRLGVLTEIMLISRT